MPETEKPGDFIPWEELPDSDRENFAALLNRRYGADVTVEEAAEYYGNREKLEADYGETERNPESRLECSKCFTPLYRSDLPSLKLTGCCPNCGEQIGPVPKPGECALCESTDSVEAVTVTNEETGVVTEGYLCTSCRRDAQGESSA